MKNFRVLGICGGNGVILHPLKNYLIGNIEPRSVFHTKEDKQWKINFPDVPLYNRAEYLQRVDFGKVDVIIGAPDCGHSSMLAYSRAKKLSNPLENESFNLFMSSIKKYKPKLFLMENLEKMLEMVPLEAFKENFRSYTFICHIGSVSEFGNSQKNRKRLIMIGVKRRAFKHNLQEVLDHFNDIYQVNEIQTCGELFKKFDDTENIKLGHARENIDEVITMYSGFKISLKDAQRYWLANPHEKRWRVTDRKFTSAPAVYRNLDSEYPAVVRKANRQFNSQGLQMSPRECAIIQGVPKRFHIYMDNVKKNYWINKGRATVTKCPPYEIGKWFSKQIKKI